MAGRFDGLSDAEWKLFEDIFPEKKRSRRGMPAAPSRMMLNSLPRILITGCRWRDLPRGRRWASKSSSHRRLKSWHFDGTLDALKARLLGIAQTKEMNQWKSGAAGRLFFPLGKGAATG